MFYKRDKNEQRLKRHRRVRGKISGTTETPRLSVFRSTKHIYAQIIDDTTGNTLCADSIAEDMYITVVLQHLLKVLVTTDSNSDEEELTWKELMHQLLNFRKE